jgi:hypothetical protein
VPKAVHADTALALMKSISFVMGGCDRDRREGPQSTLALATRTTKYNRLAVINIVVLAASSFMALKRMSDNLEGKSK